VGQVTILRRLVTCPQQFIPARIDDMVQIIAERQPEITRLGRIIAFHVELGAIGVRDAMLLDKRIRNVQGYDKPASKNLRWMPMFMLT